MKHHQTVRTDISGETVAHALQYALTAKDSEDTHDFFDIAQHYLQLRQRGRQVGWFVRAKGQTRKIGNALRSEGDPAYLSVKDARRRAGEMFYAMKPRNLLDLSRTAGWTWAELDRQYQASLRGLRKVGHRIKPPSQGTQDDVRGCFNKPAFASWQKIKLSELTPVHLIKLIEDVHRTRGHRASEKTLGYVKAALSWALSQEPLLSGLIGSMPWWTAIRPQQPTATELAAMQKNQNDLIAAKDAFTIDDLAQFLVRHERYCAARSGNQSISPGVRWSLWWVAITANRRATTVKLQRCDLKTSDPRNPYTTQWHPWGTAEWPPETVKNKLPFMLPIPPIGLHVANSCMWDWRLRVARKRGFRDMTQWVFASTRRQPRRNRPPSDPSTYPSSLNGHIRAMRGKKGKNAINYLKDLPDLWPHLVRSAMTNYFAAHRLTVPRVAASAMIGHTLPNDKDLDYDRISKTTEEYYLTAQHMELKALAMKVWSDALLQAYVNAEGSLPMPAETDPSKPMGPDWILPRLPGKGPSRRRAALTSPARPVKATEQAPRRAAAPPAAA